MTSRRQRAPQTPGANLSVYLHKPTGRIIMYDRHHIWDITDLAVQGHMVTSLMQAARHNQPPDKSPTLPEPTLLANADRWKLQDLLKLAWLNHPGTDREELILFTANLRTFTTSSSPESLDL